MARMRDGSTTDDYRNALSGEGEFMSLGYEWSDKPHRLVYDLCGEIDYLRGVLDSLVHQYERTDNAIDFTEAKAALARVRGEST